MPNVSFLYNLENAECFWWGPFPIPSRQELSNSWGLSCTEIDWANYFFKCAFVHIFSRLFFFPLGHMHMLYVLFSKSSLSQLFCSPCLFGFLWLLSWDTANQRCFPLSLIFQFPQLPVKGDEVWWQYCVIYCMPGISYIQFFRRTIW